MLMITLTLTLTPLNRTQLERSLTAGYSFTYVASCSPHRLFIAPLNPDWLKCRTRDLDANIRFCFVFSLFFFLTGEFF